MAKQTSDGGPAPLMHVLASPFSLPSMVLPPHTGCHPLGAPTFVPLSSPHCASSLSLSLPVSQSLSVTRSLSPWEGSTRRLEPGVQDSPDLCHCLCIILSSAPEHPDLDYKLRSHGPIRVEESHSLSTCFYLLGELCNLLGPCPRIRRPESKARSCMNSPFAGRPPSTG